MVKLLRTDTTLDLSQKARVVKRSNPFASPIYTPDVSRTDHVCQDRRAKQRSENGALHFLIALSAPGCVLVLFWPPSASLGDATSRGRRRGFSRAKSFANGSTWIAFCFSPNHSVIHFGTGRLPPFRFTLPSVTFWASLQLLWTKNGSHLWKPCLCALSIWAVVSPECQLHHLLVPF